MQTIAREYSCPCCKCAPISKDILQRLFYTVFIWCFRSNDRFLSGPPKWDDSTHQRDSQYRRGPPSNYSEPSNSKKYWPVCRMDFVRPSGRFDAWRFSRISGAWLLQAGFRRDWWHPLIDWIPSFSDNAAETRSNLPFTTMPLGSSIEHLNYHPASMLPDHQQHYGRYQPMEKVDHNRQDVSFGVDVPVHVARQNVIPAQANYHQTIELDGHSGREGYHDASFDTDGLPHRNVIPAQVAYYHQPVEPDGHSGQDASFSTGFDVPVRVARQDLVPAQITHHHHQSVEPEGNYGYEGYQDIPFGSSADVPAHCCSPECTTGSERLPPDGWTRRAFRTRRIPLSSWWTRCSCWRLSQFWPGSICIWRSSFPFRQTYSRNELPVSLWPWADLWRSQLCVLAGRYPCWRVPFLSWDWNNLDPRTNLSQYWRLSLAFS